MAKTVNDQKTKVVRFSDKFNYNNPVNFYVTNLYDFPALLHGYVELDLTVLGMPNCVKRFRQVALT